ncbi:MAG: di-trans,poly-cis-decaprenylcistransferase [Candidatus Nanohalarchaeota archaeon]|nr:MAG: di-trans,poly-cis-decaprenylcistransferase [Candidatus Nanohaloarchaeota archaeon]
MEPQIKHLGIIMDGNRRFAKRLMKNPWQGHDWGAKKVEKVLDWCMELNIPQITLWSFSIENMDRPKKEFDYLMNIFEKEFLSIVTREKIHKNKVKVKVIGRVDMLPEPVQKAIQKAEDATKDYHDNTINFAIAYGGRQEILDATKKIASAVKNHTIEPENINENTYRKYLYTNGTPDPDLVIRTSGEQRTSGFLIWQTAYSELYFCDKLWPEFEKEDLIKAIDEYKLRKRRFGK